jgi:2-octaprenylphenol hydroxylase
LSQADANNTGARDSTANTNCDIVIIGAGLVGSTLACFLAQNRPDLHIILVDAAHTPAICQGETFDPRVVALSPGSQDLLEKLGAWRAMTEARACAYRRMHVWDAEGTANITFTSDDLHVPALGHIVENSVAVKALHECLEHCSGVHRLFGRRLDNLHELEVEHAAGERVIVELDDGETLTADLLIAADGATSKVRGLVGFQTREWDYGQSAIVTTVRTERSHGFTAWQRFETSGPVAFLPLQVEPVEPSESCYASIVWSLVTPEAESVMAMDDDAFCRALGAAFEHRLGAVQWADKRVCVPLRQRHAARYWQPGIALVGDAAHSLHPLAGQGVNLGLRDARVLGEEIVRACERSVPLSDLSILKRYERRRQGHNLSAMATMETFKRLFAAEAPTVRWLRNAGMAFVNEQSWLKKQIAKFAIE